MWMKDRIWIETRGEPYYNLIVSKSLDWKLGGTTLQGGGTCRVDRQTDETNTWGGGIGGGDGHTRGDRHTEGTDITITNSDF